MIYFIKQADGSRIKIGYTANIETRLADLQTANGHPLNVTLLIEGGYNKENELHSKFSAYRAHGEWFFMAKPIMDYIEDNKMFDVRLFSLDTDKTDPDFGKAKNLRIQQRLSLRTVGARLGITPQSVLEMEQREKDGTITINTLAKYAHALGYQLKYKLVKA